MTIASTTVTVTRGPNAVDGQLALKTTFSLGTGNNGIAPPTELVTAQVGPLSFTIPAGSFRVDKKGAFKFESTLSGVRVEAKITPLSGERFELKLEATPLNLTTFPSPVVVTVTIGNDQGTATAPVAFR